jgi:DNA-binding transcriptional LysR family regulator
MDGLRYVERRLKLHDVRVLIAVVEAGSMVKAADRLGTSQPAVSRSVAELEHALGVRLLDRGPRGIEPTPTGRAFIRRGIAAFDELKQGVKDVASLADPTAGELSVGASMVITAGIVNAVLDRISREFPRMTFNLLVAEVDTTVRALRERKVDLLIVRMMRPLADEQLQAEPLYEEPHVVVAGVQNKWAKRRKLVLADLVNEPWTLPSPGSAYASFFVEAFRAAGLDYPRASINAYANPVRNAVVSKGRFLTIVPESEVRFAGKNAVLKALPIELPTMRLPIGIVTLKNRTLSPAAQLFIERARELAKPLTRSTRSASRRTQGTGPNGSAR